MDVGESSSLTAVANKSLDLSRSLTEKIAADADDSDDDDDDDDDGGDGGGTGDHVPNAVSHGSDKQVIHLYDSYTAW